MPNPILTEALKEAYASCPVDEVVYHTIEIRHPSFVDDAGNPTAIRVVLGHENLLATLEDDAPLNAGEEVEFIAGAFDFVLPAMEESGMPELTITVDNVSREITGYIELAVTRLDPVDITYREYLDSDLSGPQTDPPVNLTFASAQADDFKVEGKANFYDLVNISFPNELYTSARFPGLVR